MRNEILSFIAVFRNYNETVDLFTNCACYWFAKILNERFQPSCIVYNPVDIHFATMIDGHVYDITGLIDDGDGEYTPWYNWEDYKEFSTDADEIERTCVLMSH